MSWNYRVIKSEYGYGIHEAYYLEEGDVIDFVTAKPVSVAEETIEELEQTLTRMRGALLKPVLKMEDFECNNEHFFARNNQ